MPKDNLIDDLITETISQWKEKIGYSAITILLFEFTLFEDIEKWEKTHLNDQKRHLRLETWNDLVKDFSANNKEKAHVKYNEIIENLQYRVFSGKILVIQDELSACKNYQDFLAWKKIQNQRGNFLADERINLSELEHLFGIYAFLLEDTTSNNVALANDIKRKISFLVNLPWKAVDYLDLKDTQNNATAQKKIDNLYVLSKISSYENFIGNDEQKKSIVGQVILLEREMIRFKNNPKCNNARYNKKTEEINALKKAFLAGEKTVDEFSNMLADILLDSQKRSAWLFNAISDDTTTTWKAIAERSTQVVLACKKQTNSPAHASTR